MTRSDRRRRARARNVQAPEPEADHIAGDGGDAGTNFVFDAGNLALDLLNTRPISRGFPVDLLTTPAQLDAWISAAGLRRVGSAAAASVSQRRKLMAEARRLRDAIAEALTARRRGSRVPRRCLDLIGDILATRVIEERLAYEDGTLSRVRLSRPLDAAAVLAPVAEAAAALLIDVDPDRIRQCGDPHCVLWFVDATRNASRRWCSMDRCGSRAKAAAYYRRKVRRRDGQSR